MARSVSAVVTAVLVACCCLLVAGVAAASPAALGRAVAKTHVFPTGRTVLVWYAPVLSGGGYGNEALEYIVAIDGLLAGPPVSAYSHRVASLAVSNHGDAPNFDAVQGLPRSLQGVLRRVLLRYSSPKNAVVVCHSEPGAWAAPRALYETEDCPPPNPPLLAIGRTMFETDRIPDGWPARLATMDEVWVPTEFHVGTFTASGVPRSLLHVVPECIDVRFWDPALYSSNFFDASSVHVAPQRRARGGRKVTGDGCRFRFLSIFKWEPRKGWDILLEAFFREFLAAPSRRAEGEAAVGAEDAPVADAEVCLYIKTSAYHSDVDNGDDDEYHDEVMRFFRRRFGPHWRTANRPNIRVLSTHIPLEEYPSLYKSVDCVVQPSRGEGWGRPHMEAMAMGTPVIATNWSGNTAFMQHEVNSLLIPIDGLETVKEGAFAGHYWASPSVDGLRRLMRRVVSERRSEAMAALRRRARADIERNYSSEVVGRLIIDRVNFLLQRKFPEDPKRAAARDALVGNAKEQQLSKPSGGPSAPSRPARDRKPLRDDL